MHNKSDPTESSLSGRQEQPSHDCLLHSTHEAFLKRPSLLFASWKPVILSLVESPHEELLMGIGRSREGRAEEVINLTHSSISKRISRIDKHHGFGLIIPSRRKYYIACRNETDALALYSTIIRLRNEVRAKHSQLEEGVGQPDLVYEESHGDLQFQKCEQEREEREEKGHSTNAQTPKRNQQEAIQQRFLQKEREVQVERESFCTAMEEEEPQELPFHSSPLHIQQPLSAEESDSLQSDEGFKLLSNFSEGRLLRRGLALKANLLLGTALEGRELLESFFRLQLWNQRVSHFGVESRIDHGIYMAKLQLHRKNIFSRPAYAYMLVHTCLLHGDPVLVLRSLPHAHFPPQSAHPLQIALCVRVRQVGEELQRLMNVCAWMGSEDDLEYGQGFIDELRKFQLFLKTTGQLTTTTLEWRDGEAETV